MTAGDQSEIGFLIPRGTLPLQPIFVGFIHRNMNRICISVVLSTELIHGMQVNQLTDLLVVSS